MKVNIAAVFLTLVASPASALLYFKYGGKMVAINTGLHIIDDVNVAEVFKEAYPDAQLNKEEEIYESLEVYKVNLNELSRFHPDLLRRLNSVQLQQILTSFRGFSPRRNKSTHSVIAAAVEVVNTIIDLIRKLPVKEVWQTIRNFFIEHEDWSSFHPLVILTATDFKFTSDNLKRVFAFNHDGYIVKDVKPVLKSLIKVIFANSKNLIALKKNMEAFFPPALLAQNKIEEFLMAFHDGTLEMSKFELDSGDEKAGQAREKRKKIPLTLANFENDEELEASNEEYNSALETSFEDDGDVSPSEEDSEVEEDSGSDEDASSVEESDASSASEKESSSSASEEGSDASSPSEESDSSDSSKSSSYGQVVVRTEKSGSSSSSYHFTDGEIKSD